MPIIVIGGQKGGTGKTTLATNLAVCLTLTGQDVLLVDADRQRTSTYWAERRLAHDGLPLIASTEQSGKLFTPLRGFADRYGIVLVDAGGHDSVELRSALVAADHLYSPVQASQADLETLVTMSELVDGARAINPKLQAHLVLNRAPTHPGVSDTRDALEFLVNFPSFDVCKTVIRDRKMFKDAIFHGKGAVELGDDKSAHEARAFALEVCSHASIHVPQAA